MGTIQKAIQGAIGSVGQAALATKAAKIAEAAETDKVSKEGETLQKEIISAKVPLDKTESEIKGVNAELEVMQRLLPKNPTDEEVSEFGKMAIKAAKRKDELLALRETQIADFNKRKEFMFNRIEAYNKKASIRGLPLIDKEALK